jgi:hypothetical protein
VFDLYPLLAPHIVDFLARQCLTLRPDEREAAPCRTDSRSATGLRPPPRLNNSLRADRGCRRRDISLSFECPSDDPNRPASKNRTFRHTIG